ncbi:MULTISPECIES: M23 family metallopeptidase [unclassified Streptomyces]|nr:MULTISPECIES: M23 family metallopeptidase [unclassified Streptomyces]MCX4526653.1 M23 family metallopeptidase [Streptomyces sp. NBC_01551]MCX4542785.1 M23 family metallopeptidase [Streptomyces sp. NBC_01565]
MDIQDQPTAGAWGEWNPTEDSVRPVRGKHRVAKQRGGLARSSTVLGVGVIAAVGAGGIATAQDRPQVAISMPSLPDLPGGFGDTDHGAGGADGAGGASGAEASGGSGSHSGAPAARTGVLAAQQTQSGSGAGEVLLNRILQQAESQQDAAVAQDRAAAELAAKEAAAKEAKEQAEVARQAADKQAEDARKAAEKAAAEAKAEADAAAAQAKEAKASGGFSLPTSAYTLTSHYGDSGSMWSSGHHTGLDFAAPTGTPVKAVGKGKITSAGWSGAYGYRIVLQLDDGTEIWYCHLSSMSVTSGAVGAGDTIGRVGATGNVTGAHLHLEVRKGGSTMDPLAWLTSKGLNV